MGVVELGARPVTTTVLGRRYVCVLCGCVMLVVPRELAARRRYSLTTIALALARFAVGVTATSIRGGVAPGTTFEEGWPTLRRWCAAVREGRLLRWIRGVSELAGRALAERVSAVLAEASGVDARSASFEQRVWQGAFSSPAP